MVLVPEGGTFLGRNEPSIPSPPRWWFRSSPQGGRLQNIPVLSSSFLLTSRHSFSGCWKISSQRSPPPPHSTQIPGLRAGISRIEFVISPPVPFHPPAFPMSFNCITTFQSCLKPRMVLLALAPHVPLVARVCGLFRFYIILFLHSLYWVCPPLQGFGVLGPHHCGSLWLTALPLYVLTGTA